MNKRRQEAVAKNEAFFRDVNENIARSAEPLYAPDEQITFVCECASTSCSDPITLARSEYEAVRGDGSTFAIVAGHDIEEAETVVEQHQQYCVVRKIEHAQRVAQELDPRER